MPITLLTTPQLIMPCYNPIYTKVSSDKTSEEAFNFIFDLYINGNFVNRDRLLPRPATNEAVYSPARILESYLSYDKSQNITGTTASSNCIDYYEVVCGEEYINPWRFDDFTAVGSGSTLSGYTVFYTTGTTANPYVSGDTIYVQQDAGYVSNYYNGVFNIISATTSSLVVDAYYSISTPVTAGLIYYSDRRKTVYTGSTEYLTNPTMVGAPGNGWTTYGPDGCSVTLTLNAGLLKLTIPDISCGNYWSTTATTNSTLVSGVDYLVSFTVSNVSNPSGEAEAVYANLGGNQSAAFIGTGTFNQVMTCGTGSTFSLDFFSDADTGGYGSHSITVSAASVYNFNGFSGYSWNGVVQYEDVPTWSYDQYVLTGATSKFLTNQPSTVKTRLDERGSIGFMNINPLSGAAYSLFIISERIDGSPTIPVPFPINQVSGSTTNDKIIEFGAYPWNLNQASQALYGVNVIDDAIKSYQLIILMEADPIMSAYTFQQVSEIKTFILDQECSKFEPVRFMFLNSLGQFDYFTATLKSQETLNITRNAYQKSLAYNYQVGDRGKTVISLDAQQTYVAISDWVNQATSTWLSELFLSNEVYILNSDGSLTPIIIDNNSVDLFKSTNQKLFNYTFNYSKAVTKNTQRG